MQLVEERLASYHIPFPQVDESPEGSANADPAQMTLDEMRIGNLRHAIRKNQVSFPSQVPTFPKHDRPDLQRKLVLLYFVFGWSARRIGLRYGLSRSRAQQILNTWRRCAVDAGYVQSVTATQMILPFSGHPPISFVLTQVLHSSSLKGFHKAAEKTLMDPITISDHVKIPLFMPF
jgi:hypothetical protein